MRFAVTVAESQGAAVYAVVSTGPTRAANIYAVIPHRQIMRPRTKAFIEFVRALVARPLTPVIEPALATAQ